MAIQFWDPDQKDSLNTRLFSEIAESAAKKVFDSSKRSKGGEQQSNKPTQIRRFYDEIVTYDARYRQLLSEYSAEEAFKRQLPLIHMILPKVKYAHARDLVSNEFVELVRSVVVDNLKKPDDMAIMKSFFEAFMGHYKYCEKIQGDARRSSQSSYGRRGR